jgi:hypothetical protein
MEPAVGTLKSLKLAYNAEEKTELASGDALSQVSFRTLTEAGQEAFLSYLSPTSPSPKITHLYLAQSSSLRNISSTRSPSLPRRAPAS